MSPYRLTCHNCREKDVTTARRRVECDGIGYTDTLCAACYVDAQNVQALAVAGAVTVGCGR